MENKEKAIIEQEYVAPELTVIEINAEDVIVTSGDENIPPIDPLNS